MHFSSHRHFRRIVYLTLTAGLVMASLMLVAATYQTLAAQPIATPAPSLMPMVPPPMGGEPLIQTQPKVVYVQDGDLWVKPLPDGAPQRLTQSGNNFDPRWSPSGNYISNLFDPSYPNVRVMQLDGTGVTIYGGAVGDAYAWSPARDWLAYGIDGEIRVSGMPLVRYADIPAPVATDRQIAKLAWRPDGQQLAFTAQVLQEGTGIVDDGLWVVDVSDGRPERLLDGTVPETGEFILQGWSGDGKYLLYWQSPILSASILADGVPLYALPVAGGSPQVIADAVLVQDDAVQARPGSDEIAVVVGAGRAMWTNKHLQLLKLGDTPSDTPSDTQARVLSQDDQSAASPVWSPDGKQLAYVGMPDTTDAVVGGEKAQAALQQRRIWLLEGDMTAPRQLTGLAESENNLYRDEAPQWVDDDTLLFARLDSAGALSLWLVNTDGTGLQQVVEAITPAPEWFGFYGYLDWRPIFAVWQPAQAAEMQAQATAQAQLPYAFPHGDSNVRYHSLASFLEHFDEDLTVEEAQMIWGQPEMSEGAQYPDTGKWQVTLQYALDDDLRIRLGFPNDGPLAFVQVQNREGDIFALTPFDALHTLAEEAAAPTPPPLFGTATPIPTATSVPSPLATPPSR